jgi:hypothetical protein
VAEQLDVRAVAPKVDCAKGIDLLSSGWRGCIRCCLSISLLRSSSEVGFFFCVRTSCICTSHNSHDVFSGVVNGCLILTEWCLEVLSGLGHVVSVAWSPLCYMVFARLFAN